MALHLSARGDVSSAAQTLNTKAAEFEQKTGKKAIRMHVGAPSSGAPQKAMERLQHLENKDVLGYSSSLGIQPLRERIAKMYQEQYQVTVPAERIVITIGASGALLLAALACFDSGDHFALPLPAYPAYRNTLEVLGLNIVDVPTHMNEHLQPTVKELQVAKEKLSGIIVASPSNPGGTMLSPQELQALVAYCNQQGITYISDEIYHGLVYDDNMPQQTALAYSDDVIVINSFSKYYSMPGWRVGWMVVPEYLVDRIGAIGRNLFISPPTPSQHVALTAMDCSDELDEHLARYRQNRDIMLEQMPQIGFDTFLKPQGAFYFYAHVKHLHEDAKQFALEMLEATGVVAMPGSAYDPLHGHHYMRFSYAGSTEDVVEAMQRLKKWRQGVKLI